MNKELKNQKSPSGSSDSMSKKNSENKKKLWNGIKFVALRGFYISLGIGIFLSIYAVKAGLLDQYSGSGDPDNSGYNVANGTPLTSELWNGMIDYVDAATSKSVKVIAHNDGYANISGADACAAEGMTCARVISHNYLFADPGQNHTHAVRICQGGYNTGLTGVEQAGADLDNIHDCSALLGQQTNYMDAGSLQCNGHYSAICY
jgi:hypothetical protein